MGNDFDDWFFEAWLYPITLVSRLNIPKWIKILCIPIGAAYILATCAPAGIIFVPCVLIWAAID